MDVKKQANTGFQRAALKYLNEDFTLLDIGCSGGIDCIWQEVFCDKLQAFGIDSNIKAIDELNETNQNNKIKYINGMVVVPGLSENTQNIPNLWDRTSAAAASKIATKEIKNFSSQEIVDNNLYNYTERSNSKLTINEFISKQNINNIDFIKIDVDGLDFEILKATEEYLTKTVLGVVIEVDYYGSKNRFSEVDIFLNNLGFELYEMRPRRYDAAALPGRFEYNITAQTLEGRILQADALYLKDPCKKLSQVNNNFTLQQLLKLTLLLDMLSLSSWAAELLINFHDEFVQKDINIEIMLDLLAQDAHKKYGFNMANCNKMLINGITYKEYVKIFQENYKLFFPSSQNKPIEDITNKKLPFLKKLISLSINKEGK